MSIDPRVIAGLITEDPDVFSEGYPPNKEYGRNSETRRKVFELMTGFDAPLPFKRIAWMLAWAMTVH